MGNRTDAVVLLPAGMTHKRIEASSDLLVVDAQPASHSNFDTLRRKKVQYASGRQRIVEVRPPETDPVLGQASLRET